MNEEQQKYNKLKNALNAADKAHFDTNLSEDYKLNIRPCKDVSLGLFVKDTLLEGSYRAHPTTIAAMRKDIFVAGESLFEDLEILYTCNSCHIELDLQFWHFCPYCEAAFEIDASHNSDVKNC